MDSLHADPIIKRLPKTLKTLPALLKKTFDFPSIETWVNLKSLGAVGDGTTDTTIRRD
jgi:hypothetical protein